MTLGTELKRYSTARELVGVLRYEWRTRKAFDSRRAMFRAWWWSLVRRYPCELCDHCGRPVRQVWRAADDLWLRVKWPGHQDAAWFKAGLPAPGVLCAACFVDVAEERGERVYGLYVGPDQFKAWEGRVNA